MSEHPAYNDAFWMPFTASAGYAKDPRVIAAADGTHFVSDDGRRVFDSLSGLWCTGYGHNRPEIADAVSHQLKHLDFAPTFQYGHPGAFQLAERLTGLAPEGLNHVFFTTRAPSAPTPR